MDIIVGANQMKKYLDLLKNKNIVVVANNTSSFLKMTKQNPITNTWLVPYCP